MNERVQALRELSVTTQPHIDMERAKSETATYKKYEGQLSVPELRAQVLYDYFAAKTLYIGEGELIVGEKGDSPHGAPTFPELCCHTLEDMHVMNDRELISFSVKEEDYDYQEKEIIPFWEKRSTRSKILANMSDQWKDCYAAGIFTEFMEQRGPGHTVGSFKLYEKGFLDYKADIQASIDSLDYFHDTEAFEKRSAAFFTKGLAFNKFTGSRGKSGSNDANAEYLARLRKVMDDAGVTYQFAELGKVDVGGGGTIAYIMANYGMEVIDSGVAVLSMHAPYEVSSKADVYEAVKGYRAFLLNM